VPDSDSCGPWTVHVWCKELALKTTHDAIGAVAGQAASWLRRTTLEQRIALEFAKKIPLPGEAEVKETISTLRILDVFLCATEGIGGMLWLRNLTFSISTLVPPIEHERERAEAQVQGEKRPRRAGRSLGLARKCTGSRSRVGGPAPSRRSARGLPARATGQAWQRWRRFQRWLPPRRGLVGLRQVDGCAALRGTGRAG
jgi:hypothetical protein